MPVGRAAAPEWRAPLALPAKRAPCFGSTSLVDPRSLRPRSSKGTAAEMPLAMGGTALSGNRGSPDVPDQGRSKWSPGEPGHCYVQVVLTISVRQRGVSGALTQTVAKSQVWIGRGPGNDLVLKRHNVSNTHCAVFVASDGHLLLQDYGSTNGTWVNGLRVPANESLWVHPADQVVVGDYVLTFELNQPDSASANRRNVGAASGQRPIAEDPPGPKARRSALTAEVAQAMSKPWEILGVPRGCPLSVAKAAYRELVAGSHPDKAAHLGSKAEAAANSRTLLLNLAYQQIAILARSGAWQASRPDPRPHAESPAAGPDASKDQSPRADPQPPPKRSETPIPSRERPEAAPKSANAPEPDRTAEGAIGAGRRLLAAGKYPEAAERFKEALGIDAGDWSAYLGLGFALLKTNEVALAILSLERARELAHKSTNVDHRWIARGPVDGVEYIHYHLACAYARRGAKEEALFALEQAVQLGFSQPNVMSEDADLSVLRDDAGLKREFERLVGLARTGWPAGGVR